MSKILTEHLPSTPLASVRGRKGLALVVSLGLHGLGLAALLGFAWLAGDSRSQQPSEPVSVEFATPTIENSEETAQPEPEPPKRPKPLQSRPKPAQALLAVRVSELAPLEVRPNLETKPTVPETELPKFTASLDFAVEEPAPKAKPQKTTPAPKTKSAPTSASKRSQTTTKPPPRRPAKTIAASPTRRVSPVYPSSSRNSGHQGTAIFTTTISTSGRISSLRLSKSSGYSALDRAAETALRRWKFRPATRGGVAVVSQLRVPISFRLR